MASKYHIWYSGVVIMEFSDAAQWLWIEGEESPLNFWLRARRVFHCPLEIQRATLLLSADSRYELFLNGAWLGVGPIRAYPWAYSYDQYDITSWLQRGGENALAVRVVHWGDFSFQYVRGRGGLLCELILTLADGSEQRVSSDSSWRVSPDPAFTRATMRIAPQFGFEEHYDACQAEGDWTMPGFVDERWQAAKAIGPVGTGPWQHLTPRPIPFLTRDDVFPTRVLAAELAQPLPGYCWSFNLRHRINPSPCGINTEEVGTQGRALLTEIITSEPCLIKIHETADYTSHMYSCRGQSERTRSFALQAGRNLFVCGGSVEWPSFIIETEVALAFDASRILANDTTDAASSAWAYIGPIDERTTLPEVLAASNPTALPAATRHPLAASENLAPDIFLLTTTQRFRLPTNGFCDPTIDRPQPRERVPGTQTPLIDQPSALLHDTDSFSTVYPQPGGDIHLVIDFEQQAVGYLQLELDAPEGTVIDANMFEGIDDSGIFWTHLVRNSLRYVCRAGRQTFRSSVRRGFRYVSLTIRGASGPLKIYNVRLLLSTYPVERRGRFTCNEIALTRIWEVAAYTAQLCMEDTYTDCPTYEQTFYVGDARNSALVNAVAFGAYDLTERCLRLVAQSLSPQIDAFKKVRQRNVPALTTDHVVSGWFNVIPMWTFLWIWNIWEHYLITGDQDTLTTLYPHVQECLRRCAGFLTERNLLDIPDVSNLVDWTPMDMPRDGEITANNVLLVECLRRAALMAETIAGFTTDSARANQLHSAAENYRADAQRVRDAVNNFCWSEERGAYVDTVRDELAYERYAARMREREIEPETRERYYDRERVSEPTNTLVLLCDCAPAARAERIMPLVLAAQEEDFVNVEPNWKPGWTREKLVPVGSPWFLFFTMETMIARGEVATAINTIRKHWGYMLAKGATTFWEMFRYWTDEHWSRSLCHGWAASPAYILSSQVLGVLPTAPGYARIRVAPHICGLRWASGSVPTPHGDVSVRWSLQGGIWRVEVSLPAGIPGEMVFTERVEQPQHVTDARGEVMMNEGKWIVRLPPGSRAEYQALITS